VRASRGPERGVADRSLTIAILILAASAAASCAGTHAAGRAKNIILVTVDTLRTDRLGCYGGRLIHTPAFDALAADGVLFEKAFTPMPLTAPSHATMMTGRYPISHGLRLNGTSILSDSETTLAEIARSRGMRTGAVVSCLVLASRFGLNQGFDFYYDEGISGTSEGHGLWYDERKAVKSVARAEKWLEAESDRPFFLWLHLFDPHHPYDPPPPFKQNYRTHPYDGEVVYVDRALGGFFRKVKDLGLYDDSLIILAGDHGESLGEHQESFHGTFVYDVTTHVPLIVRAPGGRRGARVADIASTMDIMPTALDAIGAPIPANVEGFSLLPAVMGGGRVPARTIYLETIYPSATYGWAEVKGIRMPNFKLIDLPRPELYDVEDDPRELDNIHDRAPRDLQQAESAYRDVTARLNETARKDTATADLDEDFRNRLLSLGYIAGQESKARRGPARDPKDVVLLIEPLGVARAMMGERKWDKAIDLLKITVQADPENKIGLVNLGQAYASSGKREEAKDVLRKALSIYPDSEEIYRILGWILIREGSFAEAEKLMAEFVGQVPRSAQAHYMYGFVYFYAKQWDRAIEAFQHARELNPKFPKAPYLMAICYEKIGRRAEALKALDAYLKLERDVESLFRDPYFADLRKTPEFAALVRRYV
jgi:arylsulfatase A-like enzyme/Flp pilus assembly protein TadD